MSTDRPSGDDRGGPNAGGSYPADLDQRERFLLYCLSRHGTMALWDLADEVVVWTTGKRVPDVPAERCRTVYLTLYHTHVPRLERAGLVEYEDDRDLVALSDAALGVACRKPAPPTGTPRPD